MRTHGRRIVFGITAFAALVTFAATAARAATVTFDDVVVGSANPAVTSVDSGGFNFSGSHFHIISTPGSSGPCNATGGCVSNGTQYALEDAPTFGTDITMTRIGGGTFSLLAFDGAEAVVNDTPGNFPNAIFIRVVGNLSGGGTVITSFTLDGVKDGDGGLADFQTFVFAPQFTNLTSAVWSGRLLNDDLAGFSMDNIVTDSSVPEPATVVLLGAGLAGAGVSAWWRRRRRQ